MRVELDPSTRRLRRTIVFGGTPARFMRLGSAGAAAMDEIEAGAALSAAAIELAGRLIEAGIAHQRPEPANVSETRTVSIVIPVYDRDVTDLVAGLQRSAPEAREIIIVDDASPPTSARRLDELARATPGVRLIRHENNRGPGAARNSGVAAAGTPRVLFIDSDCVVPESHGWLEALLGHLGAEPAAVAVAPRIVAAESDRLAPTAQLYDRAFCPLDMGPHGGLVGPDRSVRYVPTAVLLIDLDAARGVTISSDELFDTDLRFGEDVDLVWRLVESGGRVVYEPSVRIGHREPAAFTGLLRRRFDYGRSAAELDRRHPGRVAPLVVSPWSAVAVVGAVLGALPAVALSYGAQSANLDTRLRDASLPTDQLDRAVALGLVQSALGAGRYLNQFWWPIVAAVVLSGRVPAAVRVRLVALCLGRSIEEAWKHHGSLTGRIATVAARTIDEAAYGAGVWRGAFARRNIGVTVPRWARWKPNVT